MLAPVRPVLFELPGVPGFQVFKCEPTHSALSPAACARNHTAARMLSCSGCLTGRQHAIEAGLLPATAPAVRSDLDTRHCARCERPSTRIVASRLCVSCFNREREVVRGANAKGTRPLKLQLLTASVLLAADDVPQTGGLAIERVDGDHWLVELHVVDEAELDRVVERLWPDAEVLDRELGPIRPIDSHAAHVRLRRSGITIKRSEW